MDNCGTIPDVPVLDADRAAWLLARLEHLTHLTGVIWGFEKGWPMADEEMCARAIGSARLGQAREIARTLGFAPGENLEG